MGLADQIVKGADSGVRPFVLVPAGSMIQAIRSRGDDSMKNPISWLLFGIVFAMVAWLLRDSIQRYIVDARNAQG